MEVELAEVCGKIRGNVKLTKRQKEALINILISCNCRYIPTAVLNSEIYNKLNTAATNKEGKCSQGEQRIYVKVTIPVTETVVSLKGIESLMETLLEIRSLFSLLHQSIMMHNNLFRQ